MPTLQANDSTLLFYQDTGPADAPVLILLHGFTGSSAVWGRNVPALSEAYRVIAPDLRGHGDSSGNQTGGYHVSRLAMDLRNVIDALQLPKRHIRLIAGSLGCAIVWSYAELYTVTDFSHIVFVDQSPLQNYTSDGQWGLEHGNKSCNSAASLAHMQAALKYRPDDVYGGTIQSCLAYHSHPREDDKVSAATMLSDRDFFLNIARKGNAEWFGKLMADHTSLDWRDSIKWSFQRASVESQDPVRVLVIASRRSGCFPPAGPLHVVDIINSVSGDGQRAGGAIIDWGGHWCYWEKPEKFNTLVLGFLKVDRSARDLMLAMIS